MGRDTLVEHLELVRNQLAYEERETFAGVISRAIKKIKSLREEREALLQLVDDVAEIGRRNSELWYKNSRRN